MTGRLILILLIPVMALGNLIAWVRYGWTVIANPGRAWLIAVGYDQLVNVATNGDEDETISSRAGKAARDGRRWGCILCRLLDVVDPGHCEANIEVDEGSN